MCHRIGRPPIVTMGFGMVSVYSASRVPKPPASRITFNSPIPYTAAPDNRPNCLESYRKMLQVGFTLPNPMRCQYRNPIRPAAKDAGRPAPTSNAHYQPSKGPRHKTSHFCHGLSRRTTQARYNCTKGLPGRTQEQPPAGFQSFLLHQSHQLLRCP